MPTNAPPLPPTIRVLERGWLSANSIVGFEPDGSATIVDTGYVQHAAQTLALVAHLLGERALRRIVNTHLHSDHCGGNAALQAAYGGPRQCPIEVPLGELAAVNDWDEDALSFRATAQQAAAFTAARGVAPQQRLQIGSLEWIAYPAPGHDPHALMLFETSGRILISGDSLWRDGFGVIFPELRGLPGFAAQRETLQRIAALRPRCVIPGHGEVFDDVDAALQRALQRVDAFAADPLRHARHGLRVLLKFQLLQHPQGLPRNQLRGWFAAAPLLAEVGRRFWPGVDSGVLFDDTLEALCRAGAARADAATIFDAG